MALAGLVTILVHGATLQYGFHYDDYYFIRPHTMREVVASFRGPWDLTGVMVKFYRPLTVAFSAVRFEVFGFNAVAHHTTSLTLFATASVLLAWLVYRITARGAAAVLAVLFFVGHPSMPYSLVAWITNQMHLLQILVVLCALAWWDAVRAKPLAWWLPLLLFAVAAFLIKEDGIMLLPAILALHALRRGIVERDLPVPWAFAAASVLLLAALVGWRAHVLGELGGYGQPSIARAWSNISGALDGIFRLVPADRRWQPAASLFATALPIVAGLGWPWIARGSRFCLAAGAAVAIVFALPFAFVVKPEQVYLVGMGASMVLTGAALGVWDLASRVPAPAMARTLTVLAVSAGLASLMAVSREITRDFEPFGPMVLAQDAIVETWGVVPWEIKNYLARKREPGAAGRLSSNPVDELTLVTFHTHGPDVTPDGVPYQWMVGTRTEIYTRAAARHVAIPLRHAIEAFREPARARIEADGRLVDDLTLATSDWRHSSIVLRESDVPWFSRMHRLRITLDRAWRPADVIRGSEDGRVLGLQIGTPALR
jgi:hypothetical protein